MKFTFQGNYPAGTGMSTPPKQLIMSAFRRCTSLPEQVLRTMQLSAFLLFAVGLQVSAATYSQTVSFTGKDVPLKTVFAAVKSQTGYGVFFENGEAMLQSSAPVTLDLKNVPLELFLKVCLKDQPLDYTLEGKTIFIKKKETTPPAPPASATTAPIGEIKGRVTNDKGEPLMNANITVKRTGHGTVTNANGIFFLRNVNSEDVVMVSFIGYKTQSVSVKDRSSLTLIMEATTNDLDKVVVQAYGTTTQRLATGNIGVVRAEDIAKQPVMNVLEAIQGQVAGAIVTNVSGYSSASVKVEIRGRNTINPNFPSDPLYIIDGVPLTILNVNNANSSYQQGSQGAIQSGLPSPANGQSPLFSLSPSEIESIEVLKDADATAIYGSRASNGVILITTKKGKAGKTHAEVNVYTGYSQVLKQYKMLNTQQYVAIRTEALQNDGLPVDINNAPDLTAWDTTRYTNWQKYVWGKTGNIINAQANLSGGDFRTTFRAGAGYTYQRDITTKSGGNYRGNLSLNLNHKSLNQKFNLSWSTIYSTSSIDLIDVPAGAVTLPPNAPAVYDSKSNLNFAGWDPISYYYTFGVFKQPYTSKTNWLNSNILLSYELPKGFIVKTSIGYNNSQANQTRQTPIASQDPLNSPTGSSAFGYTYIRNLIIEPQVEYNNYIGKGKLNILVGGTGQTNKTDGLTNNGRNYSYDPLLGSINNAPNTSTKDFYGEYKYAAIFGRINYNWENKYIVNLNGRRDGSSRFGPGRQYGNFGSIGGAWIFSEEAFFRRNLTLLSFGKLRGSYGITGGDQINDYQFLSLWQFGFGSTYNGNVILNPGGFSDSALQWQVNKKLELALALGFLKDRITVDASFYRNRCNNQLVEFPTPAFTGFTSVTSNSLANVENTGWEFIANAKVLDKRDFKWFMKFSIGINRNRLLSYPNLAQSPYANSLIIGKSLNLRKFLHSTGVDPQTGLYTFEDKNKDGSISANPGPSDDRFPYDLSPKYDGGFTTNLTYKGWSLSAFFYFKKQLGFSALTSGGIAGTISNQPIGILSHWQKAGDLVNFGKLTTIETANGDNYFSYSDANLTNASFIRLQNLSLAYELPEKIKKKAGMVNGKIYLQGENLLLLTKYKGVDPEVQSFGGMPRPRVVTVGLSCNF